MEWLWVALLLVIVLGIPIPLLVRHGRGETLTQAPDALLETHRTRLDDVFQRKP